MISFLWEVAVAKGLSAKSKLQLALLLGISREAQARLEDVIDEVMEADKKKKTKRRRKNKRNNISINSEVLRRDKHFASFFVELHISCWLTICICGWCGLDGKKSLWMSTLVSSVLHVFRYCARVVIVTIFS